VYYVKGGPSYKWSLVNIVAELIRE